MRRGFGKAWENEARLEKVRALVDQHHTGARKAFNRRPSDSNYTGWQEGNLGRSPRGHLECYLAN